MTEDRQTKMRRMRREATLRSMTRTILKVLDQAGRELSKSTDANCQGEKAVLWQNRASYLYSEIKKMIDHNSQLSDQELTALAKLFDETVTHLNKCPKTGYFIGRGSS